MSSDKLSTSNKMVWISAANVFACLGVIILHCNDVFWSFPSGMLWISSNFLETFFYWPVPIFFMISGITLIDYRERYSTKGYFIKRFQRVGIPFIFWSLAGVAYRVIICDWSIGGVSDILTGILSTKYISIYWFFIPLIAIYISIPLLGAVEKKRRNNIFLLGCCCGFILNSLLPTVFKLLKLQYNTSLIPPAFSGYIIFVMLGYLIATNDIPKKIRIISYIMSIVGWLIHFLGTMWLSSGADSIDKTFKGYTNFPSVFQAIGVIIFFKYFPWERVLKKRGCKYIVSISKYTFGIYILHIYFIWHLPGIFEFIETTDILWRTLGAVVIFVMCAAVSYVISLIPIVKKTIGC